MGNKPIKPLRILIVEDDALIAMLLGDLLVAMGQEICGIAATESDAVDAAERHRPDLMIVDAGLRSGNGISAVETILRSRPIAHIFISGDYAMVKRLMPNAMVIAKPFRESDLARAIERVVDSRAVV